jgi:hypothetical protein
MQKYIILITLLSFGLAHHAWAMDDELVSMAGLIDQDDNAITDQDREQAKKERLAQVALAKKERYELANMCWNDDYTGVKQYLESHQDPVPARQYGLSLAKQVKTARMAVLLERRGNIRLSVDRDKYGSILHHAAGSGTSMLLKYAIRRYCKEEETLDINEQRSVDGKTVLHIWADNIWAYYLWPHSRDRAREKLHLLLDAGVDYTLRDKSGKVPLDMLEHELGEWAAIGQQVVFYQTLIDDLKKAMLTQK